MNPLFLADFYKFGHVHQYPAGTTQVWSNWTPRSSRVPGSNHVVHFGLRYFIQGIRREFEKHFFDRRLDVVLKEYRDVVAQCLGVADPPVDHIKWLWNHGRLPIEIYSLPEGTLVPLNVPALVITNTEPEAFWLPNYLETALSMYLWKGSTSATTARLYRSLFVKHVKAAGEKDLTGVDWMGHDFSLRGMSGMEDGILSGMGHLLSFRGTDSVPAIMAACDVYDADLSIGGSVPATEHSVMCAGGQYGEYETFRRLITEVYPKGIVSIVSDTWDLWKVLTDYVPRLKDEILMRDGKVVIRPDSGDPVKIICGDRDYGRANPYPSFEGSHHPAAYGVIILLAQALGLDETPAGKMIRKAGAIYGDSITLERADQILHGIRQDGFHPYNMVFGIGSYTYQLVTRDTYGFAMKATAVRNAAGEVVPIFKRPITDNGGKFSHMGIPTVFWNEGVGDYVVLQNSDPKGLACCDFRLYFQNGETYFDESDSFAAIRSRVQEGLR